MTTSNTLGATGMILMIPMSAHHATEAARR
jgi:hypothetical protein